MRPTDEPPGSRQRELFLQALERRDLARRRAFLDAACSSDAALRASVEELLAHHQEDSFLEESPADRAFTQEDPECPPELSGDQAIGDRIGPYKLLQKVGEGGCGVVYMAEQEEPVRRRVALKVIKLGMDTRNVIARFEAERQALAMMDHPNIAKVFEAGATESGRPYFVMELVRGVRITEYCDQNHLPPRGRLELFIQVCHAIQHAHQKGIIHRDIKPSNILVTLHDGVAVPKVIDFGIAKATTGQRLTDKTLFTALEQFVGTPAYMSPEQAEMSGLDIDTRSDIYSLGVLFYEMLTGRTPFDTQELLSLGLDAMRRIIREQEPLRPSTRLRGMPDAELTTTAKNRQSESLKLIHLLRGDVDWIVMKCLEKDRARRYETASGLARDIQRHLNNEAVLARPPSAAYRLQKLVRRNRMAFSAAVVVGLTFIGALSFSTWAFLRERKAHAGEAAEHRAAVEQRKLADMQLALQAWEEGDLERASDLIEASRPVPGQPPPFEWRYLKNLCRDESIETFGSPARPFRSAQFFGRDLLLLNDQKTVILRNLSNHQDEVLLEDRDGIQNAVLCIGSTNLLATVTEDRRIKVWDFSARRVLAEFEGHPNPSAANTINALDFSRAGKWLVSSVWDNALKLWDVEARNPKPVRTVHRYSTLSHGGVFSPDGRHLFSCGSESIIRIWDVVTGQEEPVPLQGHTSWIYALAMSPDGSRLASGGADSTVIIWDVASRKLVNTCVGHIAMVVALAFSPDGQILASTGWDHTIRLWDMKTGQQLSLLRGHGAQADSLSFSPDGQWLVSKGRDGLVKVWNPAGQKSNVLASGRSSLEVILSPDGRRLASVGSSKVSDFSVRLWDLSAKKLALLSGHTGPVMGAAFSSDGKILATASHDETVKLWNAEEQRDHKAIATLTNGFPVGSLAFSPDGRTLIAGGSKHHFLAGGRGGLLFWDMPSLRPAGTIPGDPSDIVGVAWSPRGTLLATGHKNGAVGLWDAQTRQPLHRFSGQAGAAVLCLAFSPSEPVLAVSDFGGNIAFYNTATRAVIPPLLKAHTGRVTSIAFSPDGGTLASAGEGGGLKLWHVATHQVALPLKGHVGVVKGVAFSRDGAFMVSCGLDGAIRLWPAASLEDSLASLPQATAAAP